MSSTKNDHFQKDETDAIDSYFECVTACSLSDQGIECVTRCVETHLKADLA